MCHTKSLHVYRQLAPRPCSDCYLCGLSRGVVILTLDDQKQPCGLKARVGPKRWLDNAIWSLSSHTIRGMPNSLSYLLDGSYNKFCLITVLCYSLLIYNGVSLKV